mgnify:FL=1
MEPGDGYWTNMANAGVLDLSGGGLAKPVSARPHKASFDGAVLWAASLDRRQTIDLGAEPEAVQALPPVPPRGMFDVRVALQEKEAWQVPRGEEAADFPLLVQGDSMQIGWDIPVAEEGQWHLLLNQQVIELRGAGSLAVEPAAVLQVRRLGALPQAYSLAQNFPNPFNPSTTIRYNLKEAGAVTLRIYDVMGQRVRELVNAPQSAGRYQLTWDGRDQRGTPVANGVYFYELRAGEFRALRKMVLMK